MNKSRQAPSPRAIMAALGVDKSRLYLAFFDTEHDLPPVAEPETKYDTALLRISNGASSGGPIPNKAFMRYGIQFATTLKDDEDADDVFKYISCDMYREKCSPREDRLRAVVYLGSTYKSRVQVEGLLDSVRMKPRMGAIRLHYWTWDAMEVLSRQGAIKPLPGTAEDVWKRGAAFADTTGEPSKTRSPTGRQEIPTCNTDGGKSRMTIVPCM